MTRREKLKALRHHPMFWRVVAVKFIITATFTAYIINHDIAPIVGMIGNIIWLWVPNSIPNVGE